MGIRDAPSYSLPLQYHAVKVFLSLTIFVAIFSGVVVFLIGASGTLHVRTRHAHPRSQRQASLRCMRTGQCGASILIFGYFGYLVALGLFEWHWKCAGRGFGVQQRALTHGRAGPSSCRWWWACCTRACCGAPFPPTHARLGRCAAGVARPAAPARN